MARAGHRCRCLSVRSPSGAASTGAFSSARSEAIRQSMTSIRLHRDLRDEVYARLDAVQGICDAIEHACRQKGMVVFGIANADDVVWHSLSRFERAAQPVALFTRTGAP